MLNVFNIDTSNRVRAKGLYFDSPLIMSLLCYKTDGEFSFSYHADFITSKLFTKMGKHLVLRFGLTFSVEKIRSSWFSWGICKTFIFYQSKKVNSRCKVEAGYRVGLVRVWSNCPVPNFVTFFNNFFINSYVNMNRLNAPVKTRKGSYQSKLSIRINNCLCHKSRKSIPKWKNMLQYKYVTIHMVETVETFWSNIYFEVHRLWLFRKVLIETNYQEIINTISQLNYVQ